LAAGPEADVRSDSRQADLPNLAWAREAYRKHKLAVRMWLFGAAAAIMAAGLAILWFLNNSF
jgi:hypothetical protein